MAVPDLSRPESPRPWFDDDVRAVQRAFDVAVQSNRTLGRLVTDLKAAGARAVVFGGWVRDHLASRALRRTVLPADIDLVVEGISRARLYDLLPRGTSINAFNGFVCANDEFKMDVWCVQDTYTLAKRSLPFDVHLLPRTTVFTVESVIFKPEQWWRAPAIIDGGLADALRIGEINLAGGEIRFPAFQIGRALQYSEKLGLALGDDVMALIRSTMAEPEGLDDIERGILAFAHARLATGALRKLHELAASLAARATP
jgi:hypothetical protein